MRSSRFTCLIHAPRAAVYQALIDAPSIVRWKVPEGMTATVHEFEAKIGGRFRISLTYDDEKQLGKTTARTDTYRGYFSELVPNERVVEIDAFETADLSLIGEMTITFLLTDRDGATELTAIHEHLPPGLSVADNELGWSMALNKLSDLLDTRMAQPSLGK